MGKTLLKMLKNMGILICLALYLKTIDIIMELCNTPFQRLIAITIYFSLSFMAILIIIKAIKIRSYYFKRKRINQYANILREEIEKLNNTKNDIEKQYIDFLQSKLYELKKERNKINKKTAEHLNNSIYDISKNKYIYDKLYLSQLLTDEYINQSIDFPEGLVYKDNKIIDIFSSEKFGRFTAYVASNGKVIHFKRGCSQATIPINITKFMHIQYTYHPIGFNPSIEDYIIAWDCQAQYHVCQKCRHKNKMKFFFMPKWYEQYLKIQKLKSRYNIE